MGKYKSFAQRRALSTTGSWRAHYSPNPTYATGTRQFPWTDAVAFSDNLPMWKSMIRDGQNVSTTMVGTRGIMLDQSAGLAKVSEYWSGGNYYIAEASGSLLKQHVVNPGSLQAVPSSLIEKARTQAEIQFTQRFNRHTTRFETGVFAGELLQTVRMLASPTKALRQSLGQFHKDLRTVVGNLKRNEFRTGRTRTLKAIRDAISGSWLEWQFGVRPFMSDADSAAEAFRALASGRTFDIVRFTGEGKSEEASETSDSFQCDSPGWLGDNRYRVVIINKHTAEVTLRGAWRCDTVNGEMPLPMMFGTTLGDILPTAWELLPWSWFADYFSTMGNVLEAWSMRTVKFAWINETIRTRTERLILPPPSYFQVVNGGIPRTTEVVCGTSRSIRYDVSRLPYDNSWTPTPLVKIPGVTGKDTTKWLNIAAVLAMRVPP